MLALNYVEICQQKTPENYFMIRLSTDSEIKIHIELKPDHYSQIHFSTQNVANPFNNLTVECFLLATNYFLKSISHL